MSGLFAVCGSISADMIGYAPRLPGPGESVLGDRFLLAPGGKGANVAVAAARIGTPVRFFGARGDDWFGEFIGEALAREGVDVSSLAVVAGTHSGVALIAVDAQGENQILALPGANGLAAPPTPCGAAVWFCPGEIRRMAQAGTVEAARADGAIAVVNPSPPNAFDPDLLPRFDIAIVNETELGRLRGAACPRGSSSRAARTGAVLLPEGTEVPAIPAGTSTRRAPGTRSRAACARAWRPEHRSRRPCSSALVTAAISVERPGCQPAYATPRRGRRARRCRGHRRSALP